VPDLVVGEAQALQALCGVRVVAVEVLRLLDRSPVVAQAIGLDHQPELTPDEVDPKPLMRRSSSGAGSPAPGYRENQALELRVREAKGATV